MSTNKSTWKKLTSMRLFMPLVCLLAIIIVATITIPGFLSMSLKNGVPYGYPVDVINRASELVILSVGMTLVTAASGGQDISVGAVMAVAGAVCCQILSGGEVSVNSLSAPIIVAFLAALVASGICGAFNGFLVAKLNIQPMVATLILYTAGRSIAAWINNNELPMISDPAFAYYGNFLPGVAVPTPIFIAVICMVLAWALAGGRHQRQRRAAQRHPSAVCEVPDLCHPRPVRGRCGLYQGQPFLHHQLFRRRQGH